MLSPSPSTSKLEREKGREKERKGEREGVRESTKGGVLVLCEMKQNAERERGEREAG